MIKKHKKRGIYYHYYFWFFIEFYSATKCQLAYAESGPLIDGEYIPTCTDTGEYEKMQCLYGNVGECWCVNENGEELAGTRQKDLGIPDCENGKNCF